MFRRASTTMTICALTLFFGVHAAMAKPQNIVLIMADDMGYECVGANGCTSYKTPNLDRMAAEGMRFTHCYSQPLCTPSRVQIMSGKYNFRNYIKFEYMDPEEVTFGQLLKNAGYETLIAGKWQLNGTYSNKKNNGDSLRPKQFGFDHTYLWHVTGRPQRYKNPVLEKNAVLQPAQEGEYGPALVVDYISEFLAKDHDKPFLVYYPMILPHGPFVPTPDGEDWDRKPQKSKTQQYYKGMVEYVDKMVGRILNNLKKNGLEKDTLVIFTGDNGTPGGIVTHTENGVVKGAKSRPITRGTHVPMIAWQPGSVVAGKVSDDLVDFTDVLPTMLAAAETEFPEGFVADGRSFLPELRGEPGSPRVSRSSVGTTPDMAPERTSFEHCLYGTSDTNSTTMVECLTYRPTTMKKMT